MEIKNASTAIGENSNVRPDSPNEAQFSPYGNGPEADARMKFALAWVDRINIAIDAREQPSIVTNGIPYSQSYIYNQRKGVNYSAPRNPEDDREVSLGLVHEKIISFISIYIKYAYRRKVRAYDQDGSLVQGVGDFYDLGIEYSYRAEHLKKKIGLIFNEIFTQGNAYLLEDWEVRTITKPKAFMKAKDGGDPVEVTPENMDFTYEFLEDLTYPEGEQDTQIQTRRAVTKILDGRMIIFSDENVQEVQDQDWIVLEEINSRADAEQLFGSLDLWDMVPKNRTDINSLAAEKLTIFNTNRLKSPENEVMVHRIMDKRNNRFNIALNGLLMLPMKTPFTIFYPRGNYPITNIPCEKLNGSIKARSIPAKLKFNADYVDWILKMLALKFEKGVDPAIFTKGKYTLTRKMFRGGQVTHGLSTSDYEKADPEAKGINNSDISFYSMTKDILETQTVNPTTSGEYTPNATATEINTVDENQQAKLAYMLDSISNGFMDLALRRAETIESKYTIKQKETVVNGKTINVYQDFNVNIGGINHSVIFDDSLGDITQNHEDHEKIQHELFKSAFQSKKKGNPTETYVIDPKKIRAGELTVDIEIVAERVKNKDQQVSGFLEEYMMLQKNFGQEALNADEAKQIYLQISGRPSQLFNSDSVLKLKQIQAQQTAGGGAPAPAAPGAPVPSPVAAPAPTVAQK